jgi:hypothetical protein
VVHLVGHWTIRAGAPVITEVYQQLDASPPVRRLAFAAQELTAWDSRLLTLLRQVMEASTPRQIVVDPQGLPDGIRRLLALAAAVADAPPTIDAALQAAYDAAIYFPFTDVIVADPYKGIADGVKHAFYIGQSRVVGGTTTDMVAIVNN